MAEYISLTELLKKFDELVCPEFNLNSEAGRMFLACKKAIITTPTADVVEVVRCKDCKDYTPVMFDSKPMHYGYCCNTHDSVLGNRHRYEGDFCSYGLKERERNV